MSAALPAAGITAPDYDLVSCRLSHQGDVGHRQQETARYRRQPACVWFFSAIPTLTSRFLLARLDLSQHTRLRQVSQSSTPGIPAIIQISTPHSPRARRNGRRQQLQGGHRRSSRDSLTPLRRCYACASANEEHMMISG